MFLMFLYHVNKLICKIVLWVLLCGSLVFTFVWTLDNGTYVITRLSDLARWGTFFQDVYVKPWARAPPYLFGLYLGMLYVEFQAENKVLKKQIHS